MVSNDQKSKIKNTPRPRGAVRSARHPVTVEITGSNPVGDAVDGTVRKLGKAAKLRTSRLCGFDSHSCHSEYPVLSTEFASAGHWRAQVAVTHSPVGCAGSTPARRTVRLE